jgi:hypothetical protein
MIRGSFLSRMRFVSSTDRPRSLCGSPSSLLTGYRLSFPVTKQPGHEVNCSLQSHAEIRNEWSYSSSPPICLHGEDREKRTLQKLILETD